MKISENELDEVDLHMENTLQQTKCLSMLNFFPCIWCSENADLMKFQRTTKTIILPVS